MNNQSQRIDVYLWKSVHKYAGRHILFPTDTIWHNSSHMHTCAYHRLIKLKLSITAIKIVRQLIKVIKINKCLKKGVRIYTFLQNERRISIKRTYRTLQCLWCRFAYTQKIKKQYSYFDTFEKKNKTCFTLTYFFTYVVF